MSSSTASVAAVIVTYNRAELLGACLDGLAAQSRPLDAIYVIDNASTDATPTLLAARASSGEFPLRVITSADNLGGAGGFHQGLRQAWSDGHDRIWLMDDDVVAAPGCLEALLRHGGPALMAVREDVAGRLVEKAALDFDLADPRAIRPKRATVDDRWQRREDMPASVEIDNVAFEGFMVERRVVDQIGFPDPSFFIFYDDVDYALRVRRSGYRIEAVRDAILVRQLDFNQQHDLAGWKGFYMFRNLFVVHFRYGENAAVRLKPYLIALAVVALSPLRGGRAEASNVVRALWSARGMRHVPAVAQPSDPTPSID